MNTWGNCKELFWLGNILVFLDTTTDYIWIYDYANNSSNLVVKKDINVTFDVPKIVRNVVQASSIRSSRVY